MRRKKRISTSGGGTENGVLRKTWISIITSGILRHTATLSPVLFLLQLEHDQLLRKLDEISSLIIHRSRGRRQVSAAKKNYNDMDQLLPRLSLGKSWCLLTSTVGSKFGAWILVCIPPLANRARHPPRLLGEKISNVTNVKLPIKIKTLPPDEFSDLQKSDKPDM